MSKKQLRDAVKTGAAALATLLLPQASYQNMVLVLSHMRSASTAICNVMCAHPDVLGYGETHVSHRNQQGPGSVAVNLIRHREFRFRAPLMMDKILHDELDAHLSKEFRSAKVLFLIRNPKPAVASIQNLSVQTGMRDTETAEGAARYYETRVKRLTELWECVPVERRFGLRTETLLAEPEKTISKLGGWLNLSQPLQNSYVPKAASARHGVGDPLYSACAQRIEVRKPRPDLKWGQVSEGAQTRCTAAHQKLLGLFASDMVNRS